MQKGQVWEAGTRFFWVGSRQILRKDEVMQRMAMWWKVVRPAATWLLNMIFAPVLAAILTAAILSWMLQH